MTRRDLAERIVSQFSGRGDRRDVWGALDLLLPTEDFLNMGYSGAYQTHLVGSPQLRLVERVVDELSSVDDGWADGRLLDLGCGRGGAATHVAESHDADVVGVDLVPYNVRTAADRARRRDESTVEHPPARRVATVARTPAFVVGDATRLPFDRGAFASCIAVDSIVYMPEKRDVFGELARVLAPGGVCVVSDLLVGAPNAVDDRDLERFRAAWDMPQPWTLAAYRGAIEGAGLSVRAVTDLSAHSIRRFRKWTRLVLRLADGPFGGGLRRTLEWRGLDPETVLRQVRAAHAALPALRHVLVAIRAPDGPDPDRDPVRPSR